MDYTLIDNSEALVKKIEEWNALSRIAVDFEAEFNLHVYGEHLCLIQIYDGEEYYIIDPRSGRMTKDALRAFFQSDVRKVWFDMQSDNSLIFKNYNASLKNVSDVKIMASLLGNNRNLLFLIETYLGISKEGENKKKLQQTNWMTRPLEEKQIEYALSDVEYLFALEDVLMPLLKEQGLEKQFIARMKDASHPSKGKPGWMSITNWKLLNQAQKSATREYYIARDVVAKRFNVPAYFVLDKHRISEAGKKCPETKEELFRIIGPINQRFKVALTDSLNKAFENLH